MELSEELNEPPAVARGPRLDLPLEMPAKGADIVRGAVTADIADDLAFDQSARRIGLLHFPQRRIGDEGAAISLQRDDARERKAPQRFAHERASDAKLRREIGLAELLPRSEALIDDERRDGVRRTVVCGEPVKEPSPPELARFAPRLRARRRFNRLAARGFHPLAGALEHFQDRLRRQLEAMAAAEFGPQAMDAEILAPPQPENERFFAPEYFPIGRGSRPAAEILEAVEAGLRVSAPPFSQRWARNVEPRADEPRVSCRFVGFHPA